MLQKPTCTSQQPETQHNPLIINAFLAILEHVPDRNGYRLAILILLRTGMRINEVVAIKKKDFIDGIIYVEKVISDNMLKLRRKSGGMFLIA